MKNFNGMMVAGRTMLAIAILSIVSIAVAEAAAPELPAGITADIQQSILRAAMGHIEGHLTPDSNYCSHWQDGEGLKKVPKEKCSKQDMEKTINEQTEAAIANDEVTATDAVVSLLKQAGVFHVNSDNDHYQCSQEGNKRAEELIQGIVSLHIEPKPTFNKARNINVLPDRVSQKRYNEKLEGFNSICGPVETQKLMTVLNWLNLLLEPINGARLKEATRIREEIRIAGINAEEILAQDRKARTLKVYEDNPDAGPKSLGKPAVLKLSVAGKLAGISTENGGLFVIELQTGRRLIANEKNQVPVEAIDFNSDSTIMAYAAGAKVYIVDIASGKLISSSKRFVGTPYRIAFSPDGRSLLINNCGGLSKTYSGTSGGSLAAICVLEVPSLRIKWGDFDSAIAAKKDLKNTSYTFAWLHNGKQFVTCGLGEDSDGCQIINADNYRMSQEIKGNRLFRPSFPFAVSPDDKMIISLANGSVLSAWSTETGELLFGANRSGKDINSYAHAQWFSVMPDGQTVSLLDSDGMVKNIKLNTFDVLKETKLDIGMDRPDILVMENRNNGTSISPTGETYVTLSSDNQNSLDEYSIQWGVMPK